MKARPEFGKLSTPARQEQRRESVSSTAVVIFGIIGTMSLMYSHHIDPDVAFKALRKTGVENDLLAWDNSIWTTAGVVTPTESKKGPGLTTRNSFQSRRAAVRVLKDYMGIVDDDE